MKSETTILLLTLAIVSCTTAERPPTQEEKASTETEVETLMALEESVVAAFRAGEIDPLASLYSSDVVVLPPGEPALIGKEAVLEWLGDLFDQFSVDEFASPVDEVIVAGDWAFSRGRFSWLVSPKSGGEPARDGGTFIVIWSRAPHGSWQRARVIWNNGQPEAAL